MRRLHALPSSLRLLLLFLCLSCGSPHEAEASKSEGPKKKLKMRADRKELVLELPPLEGLNFQEPFSRYDDPKKFSKEYQRAFPKEAKDLGSQFFDDLFELLASKRDRLIKEAKELNSKKALTSVVGIRNCINTCFLNSVMQPLLHTVNLQAFLLKGKFPDKSYLEHTQKFFQRYFDAGVGGRSTLSSEEGAQDFTNDVKNRIFDNSKHMEQEDSAEFLTRLVSKLSSEAQAVDLGEKNLKVLEEKYSEKSKSKALFQEGPVRSLPFAFFRALAKPSTEWNALSEVFTFYSVSENAYTRTTGESVSSYTLGVRNVLELPVRSLQNGGKLLRSFKEAFDEEYGNSETVSFCDDRDETGKVLVHRGVSQKSKKIIFPGEYSPLKQQNFGLATLVVQLKRFSFSLEDYSSLKLGHKFSFPEVLKIKRPLSEDTERHLTYELYASTSHSGSTSGGHYTSSVKVGREQWYDCNDSHCSKTDVDSVLGDRGAYLLYYRLVESEVRKVLSYSALSDIHKALEEFEFKFVDGKKPGYSRRRMKFENDLILPQRSGTGVTFEWEADYPSGVKIVGDVAVHLNKKKMVSKNKYFKLKVVARKRGKKIETSFDLKYKKRTREYAWDTQRWFVQAKHKDLVGKKLWNGAKEHLKNLVESSGRPFDEQYLYYNKGDIKECANSSEIEMTEKERKIFREVYKKLGD